MKKLIKKMYNSFRDKIFDFFRNIRLMSKRKRLKNRNVSIICSDCIGGVIYHDFKLRFNSPTINLYIKPSDFIKFCSNLNYYLNQKLKKAESNARIIGKLDDINIVFLHYSSFEEAKKKWNDRLKRIDQSNMCFILTCKDGYKKEDIINFNKLKTKNKVVFTPKEYNRYECSYYIEESQSNNEIKFLGTKVNCFGKKLIDDFDVVTFLNNVGDDNDKS